MSETAGLGSAGAAGAAGQPAEEVAAAVLPILTGLFRDYFQQHPEPASDLRRVLSSGGPGALAGILTSRQDDIGRALAEARKDGAALAAETGLAPEAQAAAQAAEFAMDTMGAVVAKPINALCEGPLQETLMAMAQELDDDPDEDPGELAELGDEEYQLIYHDLFGDLLDEPQS